jgi:hypothetical protein
MKFYTHLDKCVFKVSTNFKINRICKSIADLKIRLELEFCWGFLNRIQYGTNSDYDQKLHRLGVRSDSKIYLPINQSQIAPKQLELKGSSQIHKRGEEKTQEQRNSKFQQKWKLRLRANQSHGQNRPPYLGLIDNDYKKQTRRFKTLRVSGYKIGVL